MICQNAQVFDNAHITSPSYHEESPPKQGEERKRRWRQPQQRSGKLESSKELPFLEDPCSLRAIKKESLRVHRLNLEKDILRLENKLRDEIDLHDAFKSALHIAEGSLSKFPLPTTMAAKKLLVDVLMLQMTILKLEEQAVLLESELGREYALSDLSLDKLPPCQKQTYSNLLHGYANCPKAQTHSEANLALVRIPKIDSYPPSPVFVNQKGVVTAADNGCKSVLARRKRAHPHDHPAYLDKPNLEPQFCHSKVATVAPGYDKNQEPNMFYRYLSFGPGAAVNDVDSPRSQTTSERDTMLKRLTNGSPLQSIRSSDTSGTTRKEQYKKMSKRRSPGGPQYTSHQLVPREAYDVSALVQHPIEGDMNTTISRERGLWTLISPNRLSEKMIKCMIDIYCHLSNAEAMPFHVNTSSPTSPFRAMQSFSSLSESSMLSLSQNPAFDPNNHLDIVGTGKSFDPYKNSDKLPWAQIGAYSSLVEVSWLSVDKARLGYAAKALRRYRNLVEHLAKLDPASMTYDEKLAFWINLYNALMMHAYLAYSIPKSEMKFFSIMQKATYVVGGQPLNALAIEYGLLKVKTVVHRPQIALLLALNKIKLTESQRGMSIDHPEPLVKFALSFGAKSCPAVRIYSPKNVTQQLQSSLQDYIRASTGINQRGKLLIPKLLYSYAQEFMEETSMLDWICQRLPAQQAQFVKDCQQQRKSKFLNPQSYGVLRFDFDFRYLFTRDYR